MKTGTASMLIKDTKGGVVVSWTGGKDGCFACYNAILEGFNVSYLLNFRDMKRIGSHAINPELLSAQQQAIGIPLLHKDFESYEEEFKRVVCDLNERGAGIEGAVFGHIKTHKNLVDRICSDLDLELLLPLWHHDSAQIVTDFIDAGFEAMVVSAKADLLGSEWLGRTIDKEFVSDLRRLNPTIDPCGEDGEFHTFVVDGPLFKNRIRIATSEKSLRDGYWFLDVVNGALESGEGDALYF
jgi:diphthine-ammonia ligase